MPKTVRDNLKRQLAHAYHDIELAGAHIYNVEQPFEGPHPDMAESLKAVMGGLVMMLQVLDAFAKEAWGKDTPNWEGWRALSEDQVGSHADEQPMD
jgi:hypothetical protein